MAGVKGRSGGSRPGAGKKTDLVRAACAAAAADLGRVSGDHTVTPTSDQVRSTYTDPKDFLLDYVNDPLVPGHEKRQAATALMAYFHPKRGEATKKDERGEVAKSAGAGRFAPTSTPPALRAVR